MLQYYYFETLKTLFGECYIYYFALTPYNKYLTECLKTLFGECYIYYFALHLTISILLNVTILLF